MPVSEIDGTGRPPGLFHLRVAFPFPEYPVSRNTHSTSPCPKCTVSCQERLTEVVFVDIWRIVVVPVHGRMLFPPPESLFTAWVSDHFTQAMDCLSTSIASSLRALPSVYFVKCHKHLPVYLGHSGFGIRNAPATNHRLPRPRLHLRPRTGRQQSPAFPYAEIKFQLKGAVAPRQWCRGIWKTLWFV